MIEISLWIKLGHLQVFNGSHLTFFAYLSAFHEWDSFSCAGAVFSNGKWRQASALFHGGSHGMMEFL